MTTKTLGQVLYESVNRGGPWARMLDGERIHYERMAQAVAAVVREQCAQACEAERLQDPCKGEDEAYESAIDHCAAAIRSMKL